MYKDNLGFSKAFIEKQQFGHKKPWKFSFMDDNGEWNMVFFQNKGGVVYVLKNIILTKTSLKFDVMIKQQNVSIFDGLLSKTCRS